MKRRRLLVPSLIVTLLLTDVATAPFYDQWQYSLWGTAVFLSLFSSQAGLLALWGMMGDQPVLWRSLAVALGLATWWTISRATLGTEVFLAFLGLMILAGLPLLVARSLHVKLMRTVENDLSSDNVSALRRTQFPLRALLVWTAAVAVALGFFRYTEMLDWAPVLFFGAIVLMTLASLWLALGTKWLLGRIILFCLIAIGVPWAVQWLPKTMSFLELLPIFLTSALCLVGSLWVFRLAGYRLVWAPPERPESKRPH